MHAPEEGKHRSKVESKENLLVIYGGMLLVLAFVVSLTFKFFSHSEQPKITLEPRSISSTDSQLAPFDASTTKNPFKGSAYYLGEFAVVLNPTFKETTKITFHIYLSLFPSQTERCIKILREKPKLAREVIERTAALYKEERFRSAKGRKRIEDLMRVNLNRAFKIKIKAVAITEVTGMTIN